MGETKQATAETLTTIADNCDNVLAFLQAVAVKSQRVTAKPLSLLMYKCARTWLRCWTDTNLPTPPNLDPQDHMGLTGVLTDVAIRLQTAELLLLVVSAQGKAEKDTKGWDHLPPTAQ